MPDDDAVEAKKRPRKAPKKVAPPAGAPETNAPEAAAADSPESDGQDAPTKPWFRRAGRALVRPAVLWGGLAALVIAGNVWMYVLVQGWRSEDESLRDEVRASAQTVAESEATIAYHSAMLDLLDSQAQAAADWTTDTEASRDEQEVIADGYKDAVLSYITCSDERAAAIAVGWANHSDAAHVAAANAACAAAAATLNTLKAGE